MSSISRVLRTSTRSLGESDISEASLKNHSIDGILGGKFFIYINTNYNFVIGFVST